MTLTYQNKKVSKSNFAKLLPTGKHRRTRKWHSKMRLVLSLLLEPLTPTQIQKLTKIPKSTLFRYLAWAFKNKLVAKKKVGNITLYRITQLGHDYLRKLKFDKRQKSLKTSLIFSIPTSEVDGGGAERRTLTNVKLVDGVRVHNVVIKFPIESYNSRLEPWKVNDKIKNWVEKYFKLSDLRATVKVTTRHVIAYLYCFELPANLSFFANLTLYLFKFLINLERVLRLRYKITVDVDRAVIVNQHIANVSDVLSKVSSKSRQVQVNLGRKAVSTLNNLDQEAWAKIDWSKGRPEIETNDLLYEEKLLLMPEKIFSLDFKISKMLNMFSQVMDMFLNFMERVNAVLSRFNIQANLALSKQTHWPQKEKEGDLSYVT